MNPSNFFTLLEEKQATNNEFRVVVNLFQAAEGQGLSTAKLASLLSLDKRTLGRIKRNFNEWGWVTYSKTGKQDIWTLSPEIREIITSGETLDLSVLTQPPGKKTKGPDPHSFDGNRYASVIERDVAVVLAALGPKVETQFSYRQLLRSVHGQDWDETSIPNWTADFIVQVDRAGCQVHGIIEVGGVKGVSAYEVTLKRKEIALAKAGVPYLFLRDYLELSKLLTFLTELREEAARLTVASAAKTPTTGSPYMSGGVYIDPRAIGQGPEAAAARYSGPTLPKMPPEHLQDLELWLAKDALTARRDADLQLEINILRQKHVSLR